MNLYLNTDPIHAGALPISPDASDGMATAVKQLSASYREHGYDANGSPVNDELSKDLIEAARDAQGG